MVVGCVFVEVEGVFEMLLDASFLGSMTFLSMKFSTGFWVDTTPRVVET